jgi:hypothetical protein
MNAKAGQNPSVVTDNSTLSTVIRATTHIGSAFSGVTRAQGALFGANTTQYQVGLTLGLGSRMHLLGTVAKAVLRLAAERKRGGANPRRIDLKKDVYRQP